MSLTLARIGYTIISGSKPRLKVSMAMKLVKGILVSTASMQATVGTQINRNHWFNKAEPLTRLITKLKEPKIKVSITVITKTDFTSPQYASVFSLNWGFTRPRCNIVERLPLKIPPIPPRIVRTGGNNARIQGLKLN